jgi:regulator of nonsense transcripts 2
MKSQQQADREEQQRIKNLVLSYDPGDTEQTDGEDALSSVTQEPFSIQRNPNTKTKAKNSKGFEKRTTQTRMEKPSRAQFRARRLQLSDVDWYAI